MPPGLPFGGSLPSQIYRATCLGLRPAYHISCDSKKANWTYPTPLIISYDSYIVRLENWKLEMHARDRLPGKFVRIGRAMPHTERAYPAWLKGTILNGYSKPHLYIPDGAVVLLTRWDYEFCDILYGEQVLSLHTSQVQPMSSEEVEEWANAQP